MQAAEVRLNNVGKRYGEQWVVRGVNLHIQRGDFFTFLGPSGCGKTTLLRMIAGFVSPDEGTVFLDGEPVNQIPPWRRDVGMVFQNYALWPHMTVFDNVAFGLRERNVARREVDRRVIEALEQVDLKGTEKRRPSQLSGGQQQRVALARTLVIQPRVLLLDEPLSNLDAQLRIEMCLELLKLQRDLGLTTIYVTHDQEEALAMSTGIAVMRGGKIIQEGKPREIYERPANDFVAVFVGQSNLFSGRVAELAENSVMVEMQNGQLIHVSSSPLSPRPNIGETVCFSIHAEAIELRERSKATGGLHQIAATIVASVYRGSFVEYELEALGRTVRVNVINPRGRKLFQQGDQVLMSFDAENVALVPGDTRLEGLN